jgi:hypothetical protein
MDRKLLDQIDELVTASKQGQLLASIRIDTMDNPGWHVSAASGDGSPFQKQLIYVDWPDSRYGIDVQVAGSRFDGFGDPGRLRELLLKLIEACGISSNWIPTHALNLQSEPLTRLCRWYIDRCDEDWEHIFGMTIRYENEWHIEVDDDVDHSATPAAASLSSEGIIVSSEQISFGWRTTYRQLGTQSLMQLIEVFLALQGVEKILGR